MIGWIFIAIAKSDRVLRGHSMMKIELAIRVVHSIAVTASYCRTREHQRKCGCTDQSEGHRNISSFQRTNGGWQHSLRNTLHFDRQHVDLLCSRHGNAFCQHPYL